MSSMLVLSGRYPASLFPSPPNHKAYCDYNEYHYIHCNWPTKQKNLYLNKLDYILTYFDKYEYIFWIDDDAFFINFNVRLESFIPLGDKFISFCKSPTYKKINTFISSGQFLIKTTEKAKKLLKEMLNLNMEVVRSWWSKDFGFFTNGDQDLFIYIFKNNKHFKNCYELFSYENFNSRFENLYGEQKHNIFLLHFTGKKQTKYRNYLLSKKILKRGYFLLENKTIFESKSFILKNLVKNLFVIIKSHFFYWLKKNNYES